MTSAASLEFHEIGESLGQAFDASGIVCFRKALDASWVEKLRDGIEQAIAGAKPQRAQMGKHPGFRGDTQLWRKYDVFRALAMESPLPRIAKAAMRSARVQMYNDTMFVKEPATPEPTPWHNDLPYFNLGGSQNCSIWVALDHVDAQSGAMSFVPGSHRWGKLFQPRKLSRDGSPHPGADLFDGPPPDVDAHPETYPQVTFELEPGDVTIHHLLTLHKAGENATTDRRRRAVTLRLVGDDAVWINRSFSTIDFPVEATNGSPLPEEAFPVLCS